MNYIAYIFRFLMRIKWWLILPPLGVALMVYVLMGNMPHQYKSQTTVYTGVVSGYDLETNTDSKQDWNIINNAVDNLINIIKAQTTLRNVSMRLFAQHMMYGNPNKDNQYITAAHYRDLIARTPKEVQALIDPTNDSITLQRLFNYEIADHDNYVYGLFHWTHRHYSYDALNKIEVKRLNNSDMLEVSYINDDPGIVYNTLELLNDEFRKQYKDLRFGETSNVIQFFEGELKRMDDSLRILERNLKDYSVENRVINYDEQTKHIAALTRDYELRYEEILLNYTSAEKLRTTIEQQLETLTSFKNNAAFIQKLDNISSLQSRIAAAEAFEGQGDDANSLRARSNLDAMRKQLRDDTRTLQQLTANISSDQYTKEGISTPSLVMQWLDALLLSTKSGAELKVMLQRRIGLDSLYTLFSPVGSTLKQHQRGIGFSEKSYLSILEALNNARLRQKNLQMTSATLKTINPPVLPIGAEPSKRKIIVFGSLLVTFFFMLGFFILIELLDRTPRDKMRAEKITGGRVLSAFPAPERSLLRRYNTIYKQMAAQHLCNAVFHYFTPEQQNIINFLSTDLNEGKSEVIAQLAETLRQKGLKVCTRSWSKDFDSTQKSFLLARNLHEFTPEQKEGDMALSEADVILMEYPPLTKSSISKDLLQSAALNLLVLRADKTWKDTDQLLYDKIRQNTNSAPILLLLSNSRRAVVEIFTGMLPPYTFLRKLIFQLGQFGFTASIK